MKKKVIIPDNFNWEIYVKLNPDLTKFISSEKDAISHFINHGYEESRKYSVSLPNNFNWRSYLYLNNDLKKKNLKKEDCIKHYLLHGYFENREYEIELPKDFNWVQYLEINTDLNKILIDEESSIKHYLNVGIFQKKKYHKNQIVVPEKELFDLPIYCLSENQENNYSEKIDNKTFIYKNNVLYDELHEKYLLRTKKFKGVDEKFLKYKISEKHFKKLNSFILVIDFSNGGGGTTYFLNTIITKYKYYQTFVIIRPIDELIQININEEYVIDTKLNVNETINFINKNKNSIQKIFVNHLLNNNVSLVEHIFNIGKKVTGITHDYYNLTKNPQPYFHELEKYIQEQKSIIDIQKYDEIITQNIENLHILKRYYAGNIHVVSLPDYLCCENDKTIFTDSNKIVVGVVGVITDIKGKHILRNMIEYFNSNNIEIFLLGTTQINDFNNWKTFDSIEEFNNIIIKKKINCFVELSLWPETYSYTLTLMMTTKIPIFYLNKKFNSVIKNRLSDYQNAYCFNTLEELKFLIKKKSKNFFYKIKPIIYYNKFWNDYFITNTEEIYTSLNLNRDNNFKHNIKPYFIYFPQFHKIKENDLFFYDNFNDMINLLKYNKSENIKIEEINLEYLRLSSIEEYNLTNENIIQKQVDLIDKYGFEGFAIYYYWFSLNNITDSNMIMEKVINIFFKNTLNMKNKKIFFIWANENWTNNNAFGVNENYKIENIYNEESFIKNSKNLIKYFKNDNYLKIDKKPVFFIYHNYLMTDDELNTFFKILNKVCIKNGFNGVHFVVNAFVNKNLNYKNFYINFNYKKYNARFNDPKDNNQIKIDYTDYINTNKHIKSKTIQTIVYDFNNRPRLFLPNRLESSTVCVNNTEINKILFTDKLINTYDYEKDGGLDNILLVNSFNEWGEKMAFEPSDKYGYYNLNTLIDRLQIQKYEN